MNTHHKILAEKYQAVLEQTGKPEMEQDANGNKEWYLNGKRHRVDGPAIEGANGYKAWYLNGELHRIDGPAVEQADGNKAWYLNGKLHRVDGPAVEWADGYKEWWLNGKEYTEMEFWNHTPLRKDIEDLFS